MNDEFLLFDTDKMYNDEWLKRFFAD